MRYFRHSAAALIAAALTVAPAAAKPKLQTDVFTAGDSGYSVTSVIVYGPKEAILVDAQFTHDDANRLADRIDALGRMLTAIFVTHPAADHFVGLGPLHTRFPDAKIYMTREGIAGYREDIVRIRKDFAGSKTRAHEAPPAEPMASAHPANVLKVDGQRVEIIPDLQGDIMYRRANSVVWIPSTRTLLASDMAFDKVHMWLDKSTPEIRKAWSKDLQKLQALKPKVVVAGHRGDPNAPLSPAVLQADRDYLAAFETNLAAGRDPKSLEQAMTAAYPAGAHTLFLKLAARSQYPAPAN